MQIHFPDGISYQSANFLILSCWTSYLSLLKFYFLQSLIFVSFSKDSNCLFCSFPSRRALRIFTINLWNIFSIKENTMYFTKESAVFGFLIVFTVVTITSSSFGVRSTYLIYLDWKCNINFNYTLLLEDEEQSVSREKYISCYNKTIDRMDHDNFTVNERLVIYHYFF